MNPDGRLKLVTQLLDLPLIDSDGAYCGVVDDVELEGSVSKGLAIKALLVGPGAYSLRMPRWMMAMVRLIAGDAKVRVPWKAIDTIGPAVRLKQPAAVLGLATGEERAARILPRTGAL